MCSELPDSGLRVGGEQKPTGSEACKTLSHTSSCRAVSVQVRKWKPPLSSTMDKGHPHTFNGKQEAEGNERRGSQGCKKEKVHARVQHNPSANSVGTNLRTHLIDRGTDIFNEI